MNLKSERLEFRLFIKTDEKELIKLLNDESVTKWIQLPFPYTKKHADWWIDIGSKEKYHFAIDAIDTNKLVGSLKITPDGEIGCWIGRQYWNQGFATESIERIKQFGFEELKLDKIWAATHKDNKSVFRLIEKIGFSRVNDRPYYVEGIGDTKVRPHFELAK
jgi:RimJ/RimL family protein N-acetyltransferase